MSYFPILNAPYCMGETTLYNFPPNNWESTKCVDQYVSLTYIKNNLWHSVTLDKLSYLSYIKISGNNIVDLAPEGVLPLLSLSSVELPKVSKELPILSCSHTVVPEYRSTLGLRSSSMVTSYQGEVNFFPSPASLLTFSPFLQFGEHIENYLLFLNVEKSPKKRMAEVEIYDAHSKLLKQTQSVCNNQVNIISLDDSGFDDQSLPVVVCETMAAIPFYFSSYKKGELLSFEHTHSPASLVVLGNRFNTQRQLKEYWFSQLKR